MIKPMKLRYLLSLFLTATLFVSAVTVWLAIELNGALNRVSDAEQRRFNSILLADELRQSSDDLTRFARMFVQTGDERFEDYFWRVLAIRNGELPRPEGYEGIFWDRVIVEDPSRPETVPGKAISLQDRMARLGFTQVEFDLLAEAQKRSDALTKIENRAFNAVRGFYDDGTGNYTRVGPPDMSLAQRLLYGEDYLRAKASIMEPIGRFQQHVNSRTTAALTATENAAHGILLGTFVATGSLLVLLIVLSILIHRRVLLRTGALASAAEQITAGELDVRSGVQGKDELGVLGTTFDDMVSRLAKSLKLVTASRDRMEEELNIGREIQMSMVPLIFPAFPNHDEFTIFAVLEPAREVGGDFYDFFFIDEDRFCICIGDVSGKGVPSALFMAVAKTLIKSRATDDFSTASILTHLNDELSADNKECMFVTLFIGIINIKTGEVLFTNAGHNPPYIRRNDGSLQRLDARHGPVIGAMNGVVYGEDRVRLERADLVLLYTDGVTEAMDSKNNLFSEDRLVRLLKEPDMGSAEKAVNSTVSAVKTFESGAEQTDDVTVLAFQFHGSSKASTMVRQRIEIKNELTEITSVTEVFEAFADENGIPMSIATKFNIVFDELLSNIISYAYRDEGEHEIEVQMEHLGDRLTVTIADDGVPFNPLGVAPPNTETSLEDRELGGLGIHLVRSLVDELSYQRRIDKNVVTLVKQFGGDEV
jgi:sigma-B regulation protein RsbU (phosphoserine phosphatase)